MSVRNKVLTLKDLDSWNYTGVALAVIGAPIEHSLSPQMQNTALKELCKKDPSFSSWEYFCFHIEPKDLEFALNLFRKNKFRGLNLTVPHKVTALPYLTKLDATVQFAGAANTLILGEDGYHGYNTDCYGFQKAVEEALSVSLSNQDIVIVGAGGAAQAAAVQCIRSDCRSLWIGNRSKERLDWLISILHKIPSAKEKVYGFSLAQPYPEQLPKNALVVNATSLGLKDEDPSPISWESFSPEAKAFDMIYKETQFLHDAKRHGCTTANGLAMLLHQGAIAFEIWTSKKAPLETMRKALNNESL